MPINSVPPIESPDGYSFLKTRVETIYDSLSRVIPKLPEYITLDRNISTGKGLTPAQVSNIKFSKEELFDALYAGGVDVIPYYVWRIMLDKVELFADDSAGFEEPYCCSGFKVLSRVLKRSLPEWFYKIKDRVVLERYKY